MRRSDKRRSERVLLYAQGALRRSGTKPFTTYILDLSPAGCRLGTSQLLNCGERIWIRFEGLEAIAGIVKWKQNDKVGVYFEEPMHEAVFRSLVAKSNNQ